MHRPLPTRLFRAARVVLLAALLGAVSAQVPRSQSYTREEAFSIFSLSCARSGIWPAALDPVTTKRLTIGVLGRSPELVPALKSYGKKAQSGWFKGGTIDYLESNKPEELASCQIIFVGDLSDEARARAVTFFKGKPVVLIGQSRKFTLEGGAVEVRILDEKIQFDLNLDALKAAGVELTAQFRANATGIVLDGRQQSNTNKLEKPKPAGGGR